jgi:hypothetical protein
MYVFLIMCLAIFVCVSHLLRFIFVKPCFLVVFKYLLRFSFGSPLVFLRISFASPSHLLRLHNSFATPSVFKYLCKPQIFKFPRLPLNKEIGWSWRLARLPFFYLHVEHISSRQTSSSALISSNRIICPAFFIALTKGPSDQLPLAASAGISWGPPSLVEELDAEAFLLLVIWLALEAKEGSDNRCHHVTATLTKSDEVILLLMIFAC